jgi:hypothetical protein
MKQDNIKDKIEGYVAKVLRIDDRIPGPFSTETAASIMVEVFSLIPQDILSLFLEGHRDLSIIVTPDSELPMVMKTFSRRKEEGLHYTIQMQPSHLEFPRNRFIGNLLRELAHVANAIPPENEWPTQRAQRAETKERLELLADAQVWTWGLKHYNVSYIWGAYPPHIAEQIILDIEGCLERRAH